MPTSFRFWKYSAWDGVLLGMSVFQFAGTLAWAYSFQSLDWQWNLLIFPVAVLVFYYNPIVVVHNFLHCPFFESQGLNRTFAAFNSANLALPQVLYKYHHIIHHRFSNDPIQNSTTQDPSSTYRFGKNQQQEHWISYSGLGLFRDATQFAYEETIRRGERRQLILEAICSAAAIAVYAAIDWRWFLVVYLPLFYFGWFLAHVENYFEHHHATDPSSRFANSVSFYHPLYNRIMFNEGYHQEHHLEPTRHWTRRPEIRRRHAQKLAQAGYKVAKFPPLLGFLE